MTIPKNAWFRALAGLSNNLSAAWFAFVFVTPNFTNVKSGEAAVILLIDVVFGIVFFILSAFIEARISS